MNTIHLTDEELAMARHALTAYLRSFGHDEADTIVICPSIAYELAICRFLDRLLNYQRMLITQSSRRSYSRFRKSPSPVWSD